MKDKIIVEQHDLIDIDLFNHISILSYSETAFISDVIQKNNIQENCLFFIKDNYIGIDIQMIGLTNSQINPHSKNFIFKILFYSCENENELNLIDEFIKLFSIELNENEYIWLHEINFDSNLLVSKDEIIGDDNLKVIFI